MNILPSSRIVNVQVQLLTAKYTLHVWKKTSRARWPLGFIHVYLYRWGKFCCCHNKYIVPYAKIIRINLQKTMAVPQSHEKSFWSLVLNTAIVALTGCSDSKMCTSVLRCYAGGVYSFYQLSWSICQDVILNFFIIDLISKYWQTNQLVE